MIDKWGVDLTEFYSGLEGFRSVSKYGLKSYNRIFTP